MPGESVSTIPGSILDQIAKMSLEEKVGQLFIVGFKGQKADSQITSMIRNYHVGGVILFSNNIADPDQLLSLMNSLKELNSKASGVKPPLFLSVDEEGGRISRMPAQLLKLPSNQAVGNWNDNSLSYEIGGILAEELKAFGFNMDFAPVLDIFSNPANTVIGDRAFGTEPELVSRLGVQTLKGIRAGGVIPVVKHFPGHGDTLVDSHEGLPVVDYGMKRLKDFELKPFQTAIDNKADAVMVAHILMKQLDTKDPASLSKAVITDLLKKQMGFDGLVVTDDMTMGAIVGRYKIGEAVVRSIRAGSDILLVCHGYDNQVNAINAVLEAAKSGEISEDRLEESVGKILRLKEKYGLSDNKISSVDVAAINNKIAAIPVK
jgi:beta-N-acetylhexosaminidase